VPTTTSTPDQPSSISHSGRGELPLSACNHEAYLAAETKLSELRKEAFELVQPVVKRLVKSLSDELNDAALAAESR
jgi:hypothetical protein